MPGRRLRPRQPSADLGTSHVEQPARLCGHWSTAAQCFSETKALDFSLSAEQQLLQSMVRDFARDRVAPIIGDFLDREEFPLDIVRELGELGVLGITIPQRWGGAGAGMVAFALCLEELSRVSPSVAATVFAHSSPATLISLFGSEDQKQQWLIPMASGQVLGAIGMTEPSGGSDAAALHTRANLHGDGWVLSGAKTFITNTGTQLPGVIVAAAVSEDSGQDRLSSFIVADGTPGYVTGRRLRKIGWRAANTCEVFFQDCHVGSDALLGHRGDGLRQMLTAVTYGRVCVAALAVGLATACYELAGRYARERVAFGRPVAANQGVAFKLVDVAVSIEAARLLMLKAASLCDDAQPFRVEASMAKLFATEAAFEAARQAIQIHGAYGISLEEPISWLLGEAKVLEIIEGTSEIQRMLLTRLLGVSD